MFGRSDSSKGPMANHPCCSRRIDVSPVDTMGEAFEWFAMRYSAYSSSRTRAWPRCILEEEPASRWTRDFSGSARDAHVPLPTTPLDQEKIGEKTTVHDLFDRWGLNESVRAGRGTHYAEVTKDCKGKIELEFALTPTQWQNPA